MKDEFLSKKLTKTVGIFSVESCKIKRDKDHKFFCGQTRQISIKKKRVVQSLPQP